MRVQRLRIGFGRGAQLRFITHLDLMRFWERALRRAEVDVAYSEGFSPHAQISLAAPLPIGVTSRGELMDIFLATKMTADSFADALVPQLPPDLCINSVTEVPLTLPSIQSQMRAAEYEVSLPRDLDQAALQEQITELLARDEIPWKQQREKDVKSYDLRPLILTLGISATASAESLVMRLRADNEATGRPDQVIAVLGLPAGSPIERTRLLLSGEEWTQA
ncbi:MAG TPA: TIGR03936 family radical SAM-associated protein [Dehalococcoidia bacterium]|nr:TIGR03936 family radical SAM-associated protein [Dehalococcoidia bacterium]